MSHKHDGAPKGGIWPDETEIIVAEYDAEKIGALFNRHRPKNSDTRGAIKWACAMQALQVVQGYLASLKPEKSK